MAFCGGSQSQSRTVLLDDLIQKLREFFGGPESKSIKIVDATRMKAESSMVLAEKAIYIQILW